VLDPLLDILFPRACAGCGAGSWPFCPACWTALALFQPPWCARCGRPLEVSVDRCADCPPGDLAWVRSAFLYEGPARRGLMRLKFASLRSLAEAFSPWMVQALARSPPPGDGLGVDLTHVLTWVPLGRGRKRARGFDQAEALTRALSRRLRLPMQPLLRRTKETDPQARRRGADRRLALAGAFEPVVDPPPRLILVDDVLTSGATAAECARVLRRAGALEVGLLTAARAQGRGVPARCYNSGGLQPGSVVARERSSR